MVACMHLRCTQSSGVSTPAVASYTRKQPPRGVYIGSRTSVLILRFPHVARMRVHGSGAVCLWWPSLANGAATWRFMEVNTVPLDCPSVHLMYMSDSSDKNASVSRSTMAAAGVCVLSGSKRSTGKQTGASPISARRALAPYRPRYSRETKAVSGSQTARGWVEWQCEGQGATAWLVVMSAGKRERNAAKNTRHASIFVSHVETQAA